MTHHQSKYTQSSAKALIAAAVLASTVVPYSVPVSAAEPTITTAAQATAAINALDTTKIRDYIAAVEEIKLAVSTYSLSLSITAKTNLTNHSLAIVVVEEIQDYLDESIDLGAIDDIDELNDILSEITALKAKNSALSAKVRTYVANYSALLALETSVKTRVTAVQNAGLLKPFKDKILELPSKDVNLALVKTGADFEALSADKKYTDPELAAITAARTEYNKLTSTLKVLVTTELALLTPKETQANYQKTLSALVDTEKAAAFTTKVNALKPADADYPAKVLALSSEYDGFSDVVKGKISITTRTNFTNHTLAAPVVTAIKNVKASYPVATIESANKTTLEDTIQPAVVGVRSQYAGISATARTLVANYADLQALESAITARQNYLNNEGALSAWVTEFNDIKDLKPFTFDGVTAATFGGLTEGTQKFTNDNITDIEEANTEYGKLTNTLKALVPAGQSTLLTQLVTAVGKQEKLATDAGKFKLWTDANKALTDASITPKSFDGLTTYTFTQLADNQKYSGEALGLIDKANKQYTALTPDLKALVDSTTLNELVSTAATQEALSKDVAAFADWNNAFNKIKGVTVKSFEGVTPSTFAELLDNQKYSAEELGFIEDAEEQYELLGADLKALVDATSDKTKLEDHIAAAATQRNLSENSGALSTWLSDLAAVKAFGLKSFDSENGYTFAKFTVGTGPNTKYSAEQLEAIAKLDSDYKNLTSPLKSLVPFEDRLVTLPAYTSAATTQKALQSKADSLAPFITAYGLISEFAVHDFSAVKAAKWADVSPKYTTDAGTGELSLIADVNTKFTALSTTLKGEIPVDVKTKLTNLVNAANAQKDLAQKAASLSTWITTFGLIDEPAKSFAGVTAATYVEQYDTTYKGKVTAARNAYDAVKGDTTLNAEIPTADIAKLVAHEAAITLQNQLEAANTEYEAFDTLYGTLTTGVGPAALSITELTDVEAFEVLGAEDKYTKAQADKIREVRSAYELLSPLAQAAVEEIDLLEDHEAALGYQVALEGQVATKFINAVAALQTIVNTGTDVAGYVEEVGKLDFTALDTVVQELIPSSTKTALANHQKAVVVVGEIDDAVTHEHYVDGKLEAIDATSVTAQADLDDVKSGATAARTAYTNTLTSGQKSLVFNLDELTALESAITAKQADIDFEAAVKNFRTAYALLPAIGDVKDIEDKDWADFVGTALATDIGAVKAAYYSDDKKAAVATANDAYTGLLSSQKDKLKAEINDLEDILVAHETYVGQQDDIITDLTTYYSIKTAIGTFTTTLASLGDPKAIGNDVGYLYEADGTLNLALVDGIYDSDAKTTIKGLISSYSGFGDNHKFIDTDTKQDYEDHVAAYNNQLQLEGAYLVALDSKIEGWNINSKASDTIVAFIEEVNEVYDFFDDLEPEEKAEISSANQTKLANYKAAIVVIEDILGLSAAEKDYSNLTTVNIGDIDQLITDAEGILGVYNNLASTQKPLVQNTIEGANYAALTAYIAGAKEKKALVAWEEAFDVIKDYPVPVLTKATDFAYFDATAIGAASIAEVEQNIADARTAYNAITPASYKTGVDTELLEDLEAAVTKYADILANTKDFRDAYALVSAVTLKDYPADTTVAGFDSLTAYADFDNFVINIDAALEEYTEISTDETYYLEFVEADKTELDKYKADVVLYASLKLESDNLALIANLLEENWNGTGKAYTNIAGIGLKGYSNSELIDVDIDADYTEPERGFIIAAREAYNALATVQVGSTGLYLQGYVDTDELKKLTDLEAEVLAYDNALKAKKLAEQTADIEALVGKIDGLAAKIKTSTFATDVNTVYEEYTGLYSTTKTHFEENNVDDLTKLTNYRAIANVATKVNALESKAQIEAATTLTALNTISTKVNAARLAYSNLTADQKALYDNDTESDIDEDLTALEEAVTAQRTKLQNELDIADWIEGFAQLPALINFEGRTFDSLNTNIYYPADKEAVAALVTLYNEDYAADEKRLQGIVNSREFEDEVSEYEHLLALADNIALQEKLEDELAAQEDLGPWKSALAALKALNTEVLSFADLEEGDPLGDTKYSDEDPDEITAIETAAAALKALADDDDKEYALEFIKAEDKSYVTERKAALDRQKELEQAYEDAQDAAALAAFIEDLMAVDPLDIDTTPVAYVAAFENLAVKYENAETLVSKLEGEDAQTYTDHLAATAVVADILEHATSSKLTAADTVEKVDALLTVLQGADGIKAAYSSLSPTQQSYVKNYGDLTTAIENAEAKKLVLQKEEAVAGWLATYATLPALLNFDDVTYATIGAANKYNGAEIALIEGLRTTFTNDLSEDNQEYLTTNYASQFANFEEYEKAVKRQQLLVNQIGKAGLDAWNAAVDALPPLLSEGVTLTVDNFDDYKETYTNFETKILDAEDKLQAVESVGADIFLDADDVQLLEDLRAFYDEVYKDVAATVGRLANWKAAYGALPATIDMTTVITAEDFEALTTGDGAQTYNNNVFSLIQTAENEFKALNDTDKAMVTTEHDTKINELKASVEAYFTLKAFSDALSGWDAAYSVLPSVIDTTELNVDNFKLSDFATYDGIDTKISNAQIILDDLDAEIREGISDEIEIFESLKTSANKYFEVKAEVEGLADWVKAYSDLPEATTKAADIDITNFDASPSPYVSNIKTLVEAAEAKLEDLQTNKPVLFTKHVTDGQQQLVQDLREYVNKYDELQTAKTSLTAWTNAYNALAAVGTLKAPADINASTFEDIEYPEGLATLISNAETELGKITDETLLGYVTQAQRDKLQAARDFDTKYQHVSGVVGDLSGWSTAYNAFPTLEPEDVTIANINSKPSPESYDTDALTLEEMYVLLGDNQAYVSRAKLDIIPAYEAKYALVVAAIDQIQDLQNALDSKPDFYDTTDLKAGTETLEEFESNNDGGYKSDAEAKIQAIRDAYAALNDIALAEDGITEAFTAANLDELSASVADYRRVKSEANKETAKNIVTELANITTDNIEEAIGLMEQFNLLSDAEKGLLSITQRTKLVNYFNAAETILVIEGLSSTLLADIEGATTTEELQPFKEQVEVARAKYSSINATARTYVTNYTDLVDAENAVKAKVQQLANDAIIVTWDEAVADLVAIEVKGFATMAVADFKDLEDEDKYDDADKLIITKARSDYNAYASTVRAMVSKTESYQKLVTLEAELKAQTSLETQAATLRLSEYINKANSLTGAESDFVEQVESLQAKYDEMAPKLSITVKTKVNNLIQAAPVVDKIDKLSIVEEPTTEQIDAYKEAVLDARNSYSKVSATVRTFVKNLTKLTDAEAKVKTLN